MRTEYVYHVVTEKPMTVGQKIVFDETHHNGVFQRVSAFEKIRDGEPLSGDLAALIQADLEKWATVAYRELALEKVRRDQFPAYPSRMACLYTSRELSDALSWAAFFKEIGRSVYAVVKLKVEGRLFDGDACNCFDGSGIEQEDLEKARHYWNRDIQNERPVIETLVDGEITVVEMVEEFTIGQAGE